MDTGVDIPGTGSERNNALECAVQVGNRPSFPKIYTRVCHYCIVVASILIGFPESVTYDYPLPFSCLLSSFNSKPVSCFCMPNPFKKYQKPAKHPKISVLRDRAQSLRTKFDPKTIKVLHLGAKVALYLH